MLTSEAIINGARDKAPVGTFDFGVERLHQRAGRVAELSLEELRELFSEFAETVSDVWDYRQSVARRDTEAGVSLRAIAEQIEKAEKRVPR